MKTPELISIIKILREIARAAAIADAKSIARRMFVTNSFDGLMSALGVVLGCYIAGLKAPEAYVGAVGGAAFAMGFFSGMLGTYFSERAERLKELKQTERALLHNLKGSIYERVAKLVPLYVAFWSGVGAVLLPLCALTPFYVVLLLKIKLSTTVLVYATVALILAEMFLLGCYLGRVARENPLVNGARLAGLGALAAIALTVLHVLTPTLHTP